MSFALRAAQNLMGVTHMLFMGLAKIVPVRAARHFHEGGEKALSDYLKRVTLLGEAATRAVAAIAAIAPVRPASEGSRARERAPSPCRR